MNDFVLIGDLTAHVRDAGAVRISQKFVTGMRKYAELWNGPVCALVQPGDDAQNLDIRRFDRSELGFELEVMPFDEARVCKWLESRRPAVVMGGAHHRLLGVPKFCRDHGIAFVCCTEYSLKTQYQIVAANDQPLTKRLKTMAWITRHTLREARIVAQCDGLQANGTPTFDIYSRLNHNALLYFDSRIHQDMIATAHDVEARRSRRQRHEPLQLAFSGRLNAMKGGLHLVEVAEALRQLDVAFVLSLFGDGDQRAAMEHEVEARNLTAHVRFHGVVDFGSELMPHIRQHTDIFVCCHRQGDPSCTYLETAACGVPIVGYDNAAFVGILERYPIGMAVPIGDTAKVAQAVAALAGNQARFDGYVEAGLAFARENTFDRMFAARVDHLARTIAARR